MTAIILLDAFKARYSSQLVLNTSNPDNQSASTANDTFLNAIIVDVVADFEQKAWAFLDPSNVHPKHVGTACLGVYLRLTSASGTNTELKAWERYYKELENILKSTPRKRMVSKYGPVDSNISALDKIKRGNESTADVTRYRYATGTASASGTAVTGTGTYWILNSVPQNINIGFGSDNPLLISTWYTISAITADGSLTLSSSAGTVTAGPYVILNLLNANN